MVWHILKPHTRSTESVPLLLPSLSVVSPIKYNNLRWRVDDMGGVKREMYKYKSNAESIDVVRPDPSSTYEDQDQDQSSKYMTANVKAPRMSGVVVKTVAWFLESRILGTWLVYLLKRDNLIHKLVTNAELEESPVYVPQHPFEELDEHEVKQIDSDLSTPLNQVQKTIEYCLPLRSPNPNDATLHKPLPSVTQFHRWTIMDYFTAYTNRQVTPYMVAERLITAIKESSIAPLKMGFFINYCQEDILKQARESSLRYEKGGTKWLHKRRECKGDAECVARLRQCGAVLIGKTNMHELGAGTSGINPHYGAAKNPFDMGKIAGGSSGGSAAVVAAGLCPVALGVDGGGSVRMPAALCGVIGFKPTFGRVPHSGVLPLNWTVGMVGVLAGTVEDALIVYSAIAGDIKTLEHSKEFIKIKPKLYVPDLKSTNSLSSIRFARDTEWFNDCNMEIRTCCSRALDLLSLKYGWETVEVIIPEIETMRLAHYVTIGTECSTALASHFKYSKNLRKSGWDVRVGLSIYSAFSGKEYIQAQRIRNRQLQIHKNVFARADVIVTPTTGVTAYPILNDCLKTGELDYVNGAALVRYQIAGNFLGLPAITVPVGYDNKGLPIGLQFIGKPWSEPTLLHIAFAIQEICNQDYKKPTVFYDLLQI
ncbi:Fatty acid amide hydrolase [Linum grandiflorum]